MNFVRTASALATNLAFSTLTLGMLACCGAAPLAAANANANAAGDEHRASVKKIQGVTLSASDVVQRLRGNEMDLRRCFLANPNLRGAARFSWQLDTEGKVHGVRREASTLGDAQVEGCIGERLREIDFGEFAEPASARWTFVFRLVDSPAKPKHGQRAAKRSQSDDERGVAIDPSSPGTLSSDAIDNVVEAGYPLFAHCYRDGVSRDDRLGGTVRLHFTISESGAVSEVSDGGSDLSDRQVVDCVAESFYALDFPAPDHGAVNVLYRIAFDAG